MFLISFKTEMQPLITKTILHEISTTAWDSNNDGFIDLQEVGILITLYKTTSVLSLMTFF